MIAPNVASDSQRAEFRQGIINSLSRWDPGQDRIENVRKLLAPKMQDMIDFDEQRSREKLAEVVEDLIRFWDDPKSFNQLSMGDRKQQLEEAITALEAKGYPAKALPALVDWAFSTRYISDGSYEIRRSEK